MQLTSGESFWTQHEGSPPPHPPLSVNRTCEVAIIGGGITGALCAHLLTQAGMSVILVDRRLPSAGSTSASTGLLQYELDTPLVDLVARIGKGDAFRVYHLSERALHRMEALIDTLGNACGSRRKGSLYLASREQDVARLREEAAARRACGIPATFIPTHELRERFGLARTAAIHSPFALEVDPYQLTQAVLASAAAAGAAIHGKTEITHYDPSSESVTLTSNTGHILRARHVIFATGYETPEFVRLPVRLKSTYALASQPDISGAALLNTCMLWESARPYLYARSAPEGRVMIGGEDIDSTDPAVRNALLAERGRALIAKFQLLFPAARVVPELIWAGTFAETDDGMPLIGSTPQFPGGIFCLGYGGNGITFSLIAAEMVRDTLLGKPSPHQHLFRLDR